MALRIIRYAFAISSWFMAAGLMVLLFRANTGGQAGSFALLGAVLVVNGFLVIRS